MALKRFSTHYDYGESLTVFAALEAGGFHPTFHAFEHTSIAIAFIDAFGGMQISLPEQEFQPAKNWLIYLYDNPITDFDPIKRRRFGKWKRGTLMSGGPLFLPIYFLPLWAIWVISAIILSLYAYANSINSILFLWLVIPAILTHAKYVAGPKYVRPRDVPSR